VFFQRDALTNLPTVAKQVSDLVEPILDGLGLKLIDAEYLTNQGRWVLRLYIDKEGGVTVDDCAKVSHELGDLIDIKDIIEHEYTLEVSSPGLNRPLKKEADFIHVIGKKVKVRTKAPLKGQRNFMGVLKDFKEHELHIQSEGQLITVAWADIDKANLVYEFDE
jgi:ribosome maturation factor RimP